MINKSDIKIIYTFSDNNKIYEILKGITGDYVK